MAAVADPHAVDSVTGISNYLFTQGVLGVVCAALLATLVYIWRAREKDRLAYQAKIDDLQEKRLTLALTLQLLVEASNQKDEALLAAFTRGSDK